MNELEDPVYDGRMLLLNKKWFEQINLKNWFTFWAKKLLP